MSSVYLQLLKDIEDCPEDWGCRLILADWADWADYIDKRSMAECLRWMVRNHKRPYHSEPSPAAETWTWFNADTIAEGLSDPLSDIPGELYRVLEGGKEIAHHKVFATSLEAEEAIYAAWTKVGETILAKETNQTKT